MPFSSEILVQRISTKRITYPDRGTMDCILRFQKSPRGVLTSATIWYHRFQNVRSGEPRTLQDFNAGSPSGSCFRNARRILESLLGLSHLSRPVPWCSLDTTFWWGSSNDLLSCTITSAPITFGSGTRHRQQKRAWPLAARHLHNKHTIDLHVCSAASATIWQV